MEVFVEIFDLVLELWIDEEACSAIPDTDVKNGEALEKLSVEQALGVKSSKLLFSIQLFRRRSELANIREEESSLWINFSGFFLSFTSWLSFFFHALISFLWSLVILSFSSLALDLTLTTSLFSRSVALLSLTLLILRYSWSASFSSKSDTFFSRCSEESSSEDFNSFLVWTRSSLSSSFWFLTFLFSALSCSF